MSNQHPDLPDPGTSPMMADAIAMQEVMQAMTAAGFTPDEALKYMVYRSIAVVEMQTPCQKCGHKP
ncbi:hypothetical protein SEA_ROSIEPOSIE_76 [Arthrobacter phage RosiePosie]|uniref:Uncharacterized protein n=10 Tax=Klausavirus princesstrina TaxID=1984784 RepID=A0A286N489_9CAUD|nr:hypothetical protein SEA_CONBOY_75 [Arthrobacter phage Conboy]AOZ64739.1 hypothetical protein SEA_CHOCOLAT_76 [Arthrobacter phage Chocolat]APC44758.1 hypothetical protein SEA_EDGARPOE_75 [Arthrobacter phage EdgarPoe]APC44870.1 hypothetical protein SEA_HUMPTYDUMPTY_76 [Arthrobacter phage HumptyDumpty]ASX98860.1 hypothetical protein SEA_KABREEZE_76 [Arthrobacter phage Kabreeze]ASX98971.1 hypothetical protein SEA_ROSIEPOSIE_76 [Arthrobacter phage RosiePosie]ASX99084.1 hypothetical protein SEA